MGAGATGTGTGATAAGAGAGAAGAGAGTGAAAGGAGTAAAAGAGGSWLVGASCPAQSPRIRAIASCSACVTHSPYVAFTETCRATYSQRKPLFGGNQVAASPSPFCWLVGPSVACRFSGSLANAVRCPAVSCCAPFCQASLKATTWSIWTALLVAEPLTKLMVLPVYGSARVPDCTLHGTLFVYETPVRSRLRMSLRVSQPFRSTSAHAWPNCPRS